jgi:hypothetical protein
VITQLTYKRVVKEIHKEAFASYRAKREPNRVLGYPAPDVHPSEASLPRAHRMTLRQLRGWWCKDLRSFQKHINKTQDEDCPECGTSAHTTPHLFACPATPTTLRPIDLWERPREAASFVLSFPSFSHLPPLAPPSPLPPTGASSSGGTWCVGLPLHGTRALPLWSSPASELYRLATNNNNKPLSLEA